MTSSSSGDGKGRWKYFCSLFMTLVRMTVALHSINMSKGSNGERGKGPRGSNCKEFQSYANSHAGYAQELRVAVLAASPLVTALQLLPSLLWFLILLLLLLLLFLLLVHLLLLPPPVAVSSFLLLSLSMHFLSVAYFCAPAAQILHQLHLPPHSLPLTCCIGMHISRQCSTRSSCQSRCQLTIYQYAMRMPCDFAYL